MSAALPPVPDLIPISALRKGSNRSSSVSSDYSASGGGGSATSTTSGGGSGSNNNNNDSDFGEDVQVPTKRCAPCSSTQWSTGRGGGEVMGEQRSRRTRQPVVAVAAAAAAAGGGMVIDTTAARSRGRDGAAPGASRKTERHRKSDRRRDRDRDRERHKRSNSSKRLHHNNIAASDDATDTTTSVGTVTSTVQTTHSSTSSPRVNPIFVWVRQEDNHIVEVKCEDYDKRNRILLTKTAQGWRAIPRTETLAPVLHKDDAIVGGALSATRYYHHPKKSKRRSSAKLKRKSFGVQVDENELLPHEDDVDTWSNDDQPDAEHPPAPSTTTASSTPPSAHQQQCADQPADVNNRECGGATSGTGTGSARTSTEDDVIVGATSAQHEDCQNNISPLDNLLAVAELEFNQQIEAERWETSNAKTADEDQEDDLEMFIESCSAPEHGVKVKREEDCECDYNEEDDNNLAMDDILSRLEQSLQSPDTLHNDIETMIKHNLEEGYDPDAPKIISVSTIPIVDTIEEIEELPEDAMTAIHEIEDDNEEDPTLEDIQLNEDNPLNEEHLLNEENPSNEEDIHENENEEDISQHHEEGLNPQDTSDTKGKDEEVGVEVDCKGGESNVENAEAIAQIEPEPDPEPEEPESTEEVATDLRIQSLPAPKVCNQYEDLVPTDLSIPKCPTSPREVSLPKRPPSQNSETIQSPQPSGIPAVPPSPDLYSANKNKSNIYLESLLSPTKEATMPLDKEPLDLGKTRESDSPRVTCSQEEPPSKKIKLEDLTLKKLLDSEANKDDKGENHSESGNSIDTPRLLELLTQDEDELDPVGQLNHVLSNPTLNIPDPMLIPKDKLSQILSSPAKEIPKLLKQRPELRLPEALAYPHLLQDPDILVITLAQLKLIIEKQSQSLPVVEKEKVVAKEKEKDKERERERPERVTKPPTIVEPPRKVISPPKEKSPLIHKEPREHSRDRERLKEKDSELKKSKISELSTDIDAATNAAFSQMMWLPYLNQLEAMNNPDFLKFLSTMLPGYPTPDMSHMMRPLPPPTFPLTQPPPALNYGNPLELSMWQEAMLQARAKNQLDFMAPQKIFGKNLNNSLANLTNPYQHQFPPPPPSMQRSMPPTPPSYPITTQQPPTSNHQSSKYHSNSSKSKSGGYQSNKQSTYHHQNQTNSRSNYENEKILQQQLQQHHIQLQRQKQQQQQQQQHHQQQELLKQQQELLKQQQEMYQKPKVACKPFANLVQPHLQALGQFAGLNPSANVMQQQHQQQLEQFRHFQQLQHHQQQQQQQQQQQHQQRNRVSQGPIDLSGGPQQHPTQLAGKLKVKQAQHLVDPKNAARLMKYDDIAEVGSTTTIDEMHDAQKHLWHPLFGNQKSYAHPWNWTSVTATGE